MINFSFHFNLKKVEEALYLLKANEHAAAEKQPVIQVPNVPSAGKAIQLRAAPIFL